SPIPCLSSLSLHDALPISQFRDEWGLQRQVLCGVVGRVLGLGVDPDRAAQFLGEGEGQLDDFFEGGDPMNAVHDGVVGADLRHPLDRAQRPDLRKCEVLGEEPLHLTAVDRAGGPPVGELRVVGNVRGRPDLLFVAADQRTVQGRHQVHLDEVATVACPEFVGGLRVLRAVSRSTTVRNDLDGGFLLVPAHSRTVLEGEKWKSRVTDPLGSATIVQRRYPDPPRVMYVMDVSARWSEGQRVDCELCALQEREVDDSSVITWSMHWVRACTSLGSTAGNIPIR